MVVCYIHKDYNYGCVLEVLLVLVKVDVVMFVVLLFQIKLHMIDMMYNMIVAIIIIFILMIDFLKCFIDLCIFILF